MPAIPKSNAKNKTKTNTKYEDFDIEKAKTLFPNIKDHVGLEASWEIRQIGLGHKRSDTATINALKSILENRIGKPYNQAEPVLFDFDSLEIQIVDLTKEEEDK